MNKLSLNQKGSSHLMFLLAIIAIVVVGGVGYYVYNNQHKKSAADTPVTSQKQSPVKETAFATNQEVFDAIETSIDSASLPIRVGYRAEPPKKFKMQFQDNVTNSDKSLTYLEAKDYWVAQPCTSTCTDEDNTAEKVRNSSAGIKDADIKLLFPKIQNSLINHEDTELIASGENPGTYVMHYYFVIGLKINEEPRKVQVVFNGGDGGNYISAYIYE